MQRSNCKRAEQKPQRRKRRLCPWAVYSLLLVVVVGAKTATTEATTLYYDGATNGTWTTASNWSTSSSSKVASSAAPGSGDDAVFNISTINQDNSITIGSAANSLTFINTGLNSLVAAGATQFLLGAGGIDAVATAGAVTLGSSTASIAVKPSATETFTNDSANPITFNGSVQSSNASSPITLTLAGGGGGFTLNGALFNNSTTNTLALAVDTTGSGITTLTTASSFSGGTTITQGDVKLTNAGALGTTASQTVTINGGALDVNGLTVGIGTINGSGGSVINNASSLGTLTIGTSTTGISNYSGALADGVGALTVFRKSGGTAFVSGSNTYSGGTNIIQGSLIVNNTTGSGTGAGSVSVNSNNGTSAVLGGTGTIGGVTGYTNANLIVSNTSNSFLEYVAPGDYDTTNSISKLGTLTVGSTSQSNTATFGSYSVLSIQLGSNNASDELVVHGALTLTNAVSGSTLALTTLAGVTPSGNYTIAAFSNLAGQFYNATLNGAAFSTSNIHYDTADGDIFVTVPEPSCALALASVFLLARRSRRSLTEAKHA